MTYWIKVDFHDDPTAIEATSLDSAVAAYCDPDLDDLSDHFEVFVAEEESGPYVRYGVNINRVVQFVVRRR